MNIKEYLYCFIIVLLGFIGLVALFLSDFYHLSDYTYLSYFVVMGFYLSLVAALSNSTSNLSNKKSCYIRNGNS